MPWHHYSHDVLPLLSIVSPLIGLITTLVISRSNDNLIRPMALSNSAMTLLIVAAMVWIPDSAERAGINSAQPGSRRVGITWIGLSSNPPDLQTATKVIGLNVRLGFANDGLSAWPALLLAVTMWGVLCVPGCREGLSYSAQCACLMATQSLLLGSFFATDAIVSILLLEAAVVPIYLLVGTCGDAMRRPASSAWWFWQVAGCSSSLAGITLLAVSRPWMVSEIASRPVLNFEARVITDGVRQSLAQSETAWHLWGQLAPWAAGCLLLGLLIRLPVYPFQSWYQSSLAVAPCGVSAIIAVAFPLAGLTTWMRFGLPLFGFNNVGLATLLGGFSLAGALQASFSLRAQTDLKHIFAILSSTMLCLAGIGLSTQTRDGARGVWLLVLSQGVVVAAGMLIVQILEVRFGTRDLRLLARHFATAPRVAALISLSLICWAGIPVVVSFAAIYLQLSAMPGSLWLMAGESVTLAVVSWSTIGIASQVMAANSTPTVMVSTERQSGILRSEAMALAPFIAVALLLNVAPTLVIRRCEPSFQRLFGRPEPRVTMSSQGSPVH